MHGRPGPRRTRGPTGPSRRSRWTRWVRAAARGRDPPRRPRRRLRAGRLAPGLLRARCSGSGRTSWPALPGGGPSRCSPPPTSTGSGVRRRPGTGGHGGPAGDLAWWLTGRGGGRRADLLVRRAADRSEGGDARRTPARSAPAVHRTSGSSRQLTITKLAVDPQMSNNCYLLRCRATGDQVLIDAADDAARLLELIGDGGLDHGGHHPPALGPPPRAGRGRPAPPAPSSPASRTPTRSPSRPASPSTDRGRRRRHRRGRRPARSR